MMGEYYRKMREKEDEEWDKTISRKLPSRYLVVNMFLSDNRGYEIMKVEVRDTENIDMKKEQLLTEICDQLQEDFYIIRKPKYIAVSKTMVEEIVVEERNE